MIAYADRKHTGTPAARKKQLVMELLEAQVPVATGYASYGNILPDGNRGTIERVDAGVWGYEGDAIAVYVNGQPYPATAIIELNAGSLNTNV